VKQAWRTRRLGDLCEVIGGGTPPKDTPAHYEGEIPWATVRDMRRDVITETEFRITKDAVKSCATNVIPAGSVVIATRVGLGKVCLLGQDTAINQDLRGVVPRESSGLEVRFLYWWLKSIADVIVAEGTGATVQGVKLPFVKSLQIPVPQISEQKHIVHVLDEAFESIATAKASAEQNRRNSRAIFESHLQSVVTTGLNDWLSSKIGDEIKFIDYRGKTPPKTESGVRLITAKNVKMGYLQQTPLEFIDSSSYESWMTRGIPKKGDVLFTTEAPLANVAQLDTNERVAFAQRVIIMQPNPARLDSAFVKYLLMSQPMQQLIRSRGTGATVQGIKASLLKQIEISFPGSVTAQKQIVQQLDALQEETRRLSLLYEKKLATLEELKDALLHQAFSRQLRNADERG
jgi:type I restriction enzyme, S subunit